MTQPAPNPPATPPPQPHGAAAKPPLTTPASSTAAAALPQPPAANAAPVDAATPAPAAPEPPKPPARDPQLEAQYRARERKLVEEQTRFRQERESFAQERQQFASLRTALTADPIAALAQVWGVTRETAEQHLGGRLLNKGQPQPSEEIAQLRQELTRLQQERQQEQAQALERQRQAQLDQELDRFVASARESDAHPLSAAAAKRDPKRLRARTLEIARQDPSLTDDEILGRIEDELAFYAGLRSDPTIPPATSPPGTATTPAAPTLATPPTAARPSPVPGRKMTDAERMQETLAAIREARAKRAVGIK